VDDSKRPLAGGFLNGTSITNLLLGDTYEVKPCGSRIWQINNQPYPSENRSSCDVPSKALCGHSHFVPDVVISSDCLLAFSGSWDSSLRLCDLPDGSLCAGGGRVASQKRYFLINHVAI
jgi:WD40 repeat protein